MVVKLSNPIYPDGVWIIQAKARSGPLNEVMTELEPDFPRDYAAVLTTLKSLIQDAQHQAQRVVNTVMIELFWNIGQTIPGQAGERAVRAHSQLPAVSQRWSRQGTGSRG